MHVCVLLPSYLYYFIFHKGWKDGNYFLCLCQFSLSTKSYFWQCCWFCYVEIIMPLYSTETFYATFPHKKIICFEFLDFIISFQKNYFWYTLFYATSQARALWKCCFCPNISLYHRLETSAGWRQRLQIYYQTWAEF